MRLIRLYGNPMQEMMGAYLSKSFDAFTQQQSALQEQMRSTLASMPFSTLQELADSNLKAWQNMQDAMLGRHKTDDKKDDKQ
jgi:polyhydroxyalkanoate synthesis regulator protein